MSEKRREVRRATIEIDGRIFGMIVYHETYDEWDDTEGTIRERVAFYTPDNRMPKTPAEVEDFRAWHECHASFNTQTATVHDGGRWRREMDADHERSKAKAEVVRADRLRRAQDADVQEFERCDQCEATHPTEDFEEGLYECSRCGSQGRGEEGRRCDQGCGIFRAKVADCSCPDCEQECETVTVRGVEVDGAFFEESELGHD